MTVFTQNIYENLYDNSWDEPSEEMLWDPLGFIPKLDTIPQDTGEIDVELGEEAKEYLEGYHLAPPNNPQADLLVGMEVGDDRVDLASSPMMLALGLKAQELVFGMKTSEKDTYISNLDWNFCEETSQIPCSPMGSMDYSRKTGDFNNLDFTDVPKLRIIIDAQKSDRSHSSTSVGKAALLGSRINTPNARNQPILQLASWLQDAMLNTWQSSEPKYLNRQLGGSGAPPLWGDARNTFLYVLNYKHGTYQRIYGTATEELRSALGLLERGQPATAPLCNLLRDKQEYLHITYGAQVLLPPNKFYQERAGLPEPFYKAGEPVPYLQSVEDRLLQTKQLLTAKSAKIEIERNNRNLSFLFGIVHFNTATAEDLIKNQEARKTFEGALRANSAVRRLMDREGSIQDAIKLIREDYVPVSAGKTEFTLMDALWLCSDGKSEVFSISDVPNPQDMYLREQVPDLGSMKVPGVELRRETHKGPVSQFTEIRQGLWMISESKSEWAESVISDLKITKEKFSTLNHDHLLDVYNRHREWVSDDSLLLGHCIRKGKEQSVKGSILVLSKDIKLCRKIAEATGHLVLALRPVVLGIVFPGRRWSQSTVLTTEETNQLVESFKPPSGYPPVFMSCIDTGSALSELGRVGETVRNGVTYHVSLSLESAGITEEGERYDVIAEKRLKGRRSYRAKIINPAGQWGPVYLKDNQPLEKKPWSRIARIFRRTR